jgi:hypothetical protein
MPLTLPPRGRGFEPRFPLQYLGVLLASSGVSGDALGTLLQKTLISRSGSTTCAGCGACAPSHTPTLTIVPFGAIWTDESHRICSRGYRRLHTGGYLAQKQQTFEEV